MLFKNIQKIPCWRLFGIHDISAVISAVTATKSSAILSLPSAPAPCLDNWPLWLRWSLQMALIEVWTQMEGPTTCLLKANEICDEGMQYDIIIKILMQLVVYDPPPHRSILESHVLCTEFK